MFSKPKRPLENYKSYQDVKRIRVAQYSLDYLRWKMWILRNYEFKNDCSTVISSIISFSSEAYSESSEDKENFRGESLSADTLGTLVKEIWKGKVKRVRRGARGKQEGHYLNMARRSMARVGSDLQVPSNWSVISDQHESFSFIRLENFEVNNHRAITEVSIAVQNDRVETISVRANGNYISLNVAELNLTQDLSLSLKDQINQILLFVDNSTTCQGYNLSREEKVLAMVPHHVQHVRHLTKPTCTETRAYSDNCLVFSTPVKNGQKRQQLCSNCANLRKRDQQRKKRKQAIENIHPKCNKRYLERDELETQLKIAKLEKKKAMQREEYWRGKFHEQSIELESEDHHDLTEILNGIEEEKVPEDMKALWQQQQSILKAKSHHGYRWHPK